MRPRRGIPPAVGRDRGASAWGNGGTIPKRLRPYCLYRRTLLGDLARPAARIVTAGVRATTGEPDLDTPTAPWPTGIPIWIS
jgi:hypothetical protein